MDTPRRHDRPFNRAAHDFAAAFADERGAALAEPYAYGVARWGDHASDGSAVLAVALDGSARVRLRDGGATREERFAAPAA